MIKKDTSTFKQIKKKLSIKKPWDSIIILVLNILIAVPVFIILHQNLIDPEWPFHLDRILIFIVVVVIQQLILQLLKTVIIICIFLYLIVLLYGSIFGGYGFIAVYEDYRAMVYTMLDDPNPQDIIISKLLPFPNKLEIIDAVDYNTPLVRNFAVSATTKFFKEVKGYHDERKMIQCFAVFKEIRDQWNYVNDPKGREYIAYASESLQHFSGDCDDHAILMSACIRAIGGTPRIIHTGGHLYPEMLVGNKADLEMANYLIREVLFVKESRGKEIHYHIDERGQIWLNLDYTATYPGGPFMSEEILGALTFN
ncbi:MAG: transglutaminase [Flavobacterium sp. MedPE-SWcel]|uniref:transglutaminase domain-containing protein n=1 Tax=uncultured Flavobacterium sp. TaxID=165435 RepID=UPI0009157B6E|nr:transglutaminase domain-containing protein [uncultured Flavobacterium sp.]OIQ15356.1 MAG: transglutaminase [Flavobacterium sp. MedPE-SWcel]